MKKVKAEGKSRPMRPPLSIEASENQMISLAMDLARKQLQEGTASSQIIAHFLKLGTSKAELEKEKLANETALLRAKTENIESQDEMKAMYKDAIDAMKRYSGHTRDECDEEEYDDY